MPIKIKTIDQFQEYMEGVLYRTDDHAEDIIKQIYLLGSIILRFRDLNSDFQVRSQDGETKNIAWLYINKKRYALRFEHKNITVELRENSIKGPLIKVFDKNSSFKDIYDTFKKLSNKKY